MFKRALQQSTEFPWLDSIAALTKCYTYATIWRALRKSCPQLQSARSYSWNLKIENLGRMSRITVVLEVFFNNYFTRLEYFDSATFQHFTCIATGRILFVWYQFIVSVITFLFPYFLHMTVYQSSLSIHAEHLFYHINLIWNLLSQPVIKHNNLICCGDA